MTYNMKKQNKKHKIIRRIYLASLIILFSYVLILGIQGTAAKDDVASLVPQPLTTVLAAEVAPETDKTPLDEVFIETCKAEGFYEPFCWKDLKAMAIVESNLNTQAVGDSGFSSGLFQIHRGYHKHITVEQAEDPVFASEWTLNRMVHYGYPEYRSYSVMKHNGTPNTAKTLHYLEKVNTALKTLE